MITHAELVNFRVFRHSEVELHTRVTAVLGNNGAGKTSVLEAMYLLGHGRSHRSGDRRPMILRGEEVLRVIASINRQPSEPGTRIGLEFRRSGELLASVDRQPSKTLSPILQMVPVMLIDGDVQSMFSLGATFRRRLLDWGVFHVEHPFADAWREYQRALRQRNAALKLGSGDAAAMWNTSLCNYGLRLHSLRSSYVSRVEEQLHLQAAALLGRQSVLSYRPGWSEQMDVALADSLDRDLRLGFTSVGPHRADFLPGLADASAGQLSRGQQKLLAISLLLAQIHVHASAEAPRATVLIDDAGADLDVDNLGKLYGALQSLPAQLIVTAIDERALQRLNVGRMFHVEHGSLRLIP